MILSPEILVILAKGLGYQSGWSAQSQRAGCYVFSWRSEGPHKDLHMTDYLSIPEVSAACKAKLRELNFSYEVKFMPHRNGSTVAYIAEPYKDPTGGGREFRVEINDTDDMAMIAAFVVAAKAGAI